MGSLKTLRNNIELKIKENVDGLITGPIMQEVLLELISVLGEFARFKGEAFPSTVPDEIIQNPQFYICRTPGVYTNFGNIFVPKGIQIIWNLNEDETWEAFDLNFKAFNVDTTTLSNTELESVFNNILSRLTTLEGNMETLRSDLARTKTNELTNNQGLTNLKTLMLSKEEEIDTLQGILDGYKGRIITLGQKDDAVAAALERYITTATTNKLNAQANQATLNIIENMRDSMYARQDGLWYGIEYDQSSTLSTCRRIGNMAFHTLLPIHNQLRRCTLLDNGEVNYYLDEYNSYLKEGTLEASVLDGTDGQVMVEIPDIYWRFEQEGTIRRVKISSYPLNGFTKWSKCYVGAYEAVVYHPSGGTYKMCSVINKTVDYRGGSPSVGWNSSLDSDEEKTYLGKPTSGLSMQTSRNYARNRNGSGDNGWNAYHYRIHKELYWLYVIEFATLNSQLTWNPILSNEGYKQGGLGAGVTDWTSAAWNSYSGYYPIIPCGLSNNYGNQNCVVQHNLPSVSKTFNVPSYRGVENPFGHIWKWCDGILYQVMTGQCIMHVCDDLSKLTGTASLTGFTQVSDQMYALSTEGWFSDILFGVNQNGSTLGGDILPTAGGGGANNRYGDYYYCYANTSSLTTRAVAFGARAHRGSCAGFACASVNSAPSASDAYCGSRLCHL